MAKYGKQKPLDDAEIAAHPREPRSSMELLKILTGPMLAILKLYLKSRASNGKKTETCVNEFSINHSLAFKLIFISDIFFRLLGIGVVAFVFLRGIGVIDYTRDWLLNCSIR